MYFTKSFLFKNKYINTNFKSLYLDYYITKFFWKIDPIINTSWKLDSYNLNIIKVQDIRAVRFWEKFRQGTNREQYRTGVHMIIYLTIFLFLSIYLRFYSSNINLGKLSLLTVFLSIFFFLPIRQLGVFYNFILIYQRLISIFLQSIFSKFS